MSKSSSQALIKSSGEKRFAGRSKESKGSNESIEYNASQSTLNKKTMPV